MEQLLNFGDAITALKNGMMIARKVWDDEFIFMQVPAKISVKDIVPKMQSLPQSVKDKLILRKKSTDSRVKNNLAHNHTFINYKDQIALVKSDNYVIGYSPSVTDVLSEDWFIL